MNLEQIEELLEIELTLNSFRGCLSEQNENKLLVTYNSILKSLKKPVRYDYNDPMDVIEAMVKSFNLKKDFHTNKTRSAEDYVKPRQIAAVLIRYIFPRDLYPAMTLTEIGSYFDQDHTSILHSIKTCKNLYGIDKSFKRLFDSYQLEILGGILIDMEE